MRIVLAQSARVSIAVRRCFVTATLSISQLDERTADLSCRCPDRRDLSDRRLRAGYTQSQRPRRYVRSDHQEPVRLGSSSQAVAVGFQGRLTDPVPAIVTWPMPLRELLEAT